MICRVLINLLIASESTRVYLCALNRDIIEKRDLLAPRMFASARIHTFIPFCDANTRKKTERGLGSIAPEILLKFRLNRLLDEGYVGALV